MNGKNKVQIEIIKNSKERKKENVNQIKNLNGN